jgi:hypothetical protein
VAEAALRILLREKRDTILAVWRDAIFAAFPESGAAILRKEKDPFHNPVGHTLLDGTDKLLDEILGGADAARLEVCLEPILQVQAVQELTPGQATAIAFQLKQAVRKVLNDDLRRAPGLCLELLDFELFLDGLAGQAFDLYTRYRERLCEIRVREMKNRTFKLLERMGGEPGAS